MKIVLSLHMSSLCQWTLSESVNFFRNTKHLLAIPPSASKYRLQFYTTNLIEERVSERDFSRLFHTLTRSSTRDDVIAFSKKSSRELTNIYSISQAPLFGQSIGTNEFHRRIDSDLENCFIVRAIISFNGLKWPYEFFGSMKFTFLHSSAALNSGRQVFWVFPAE